MGCCIFIAKRMVVSCLWGFACDDRSFRSICFYFKKEGFELVLSYFNLYPLISSYIGAQIAPNKNAQNISSIGAFKIYTPHKSFVIHVLDINPGLVISKR